MARLGEIAKVLGAEITGDAGFEVANQALQLHGGYGYTREYPVEKYFRDQKVGQIYEGTTHMQLLVIAKQLLGKL